MFLYFYCDPFTSILFEVGAVTSIAAGWIGMKIATFTNVRCTHGCWKGLKQGYKVAIDGGYGMGIALVSVGVIDLFLLIMFFKPHFELQW